MINRIFAWLIRPKPPIYFGSFDGMEVWKVDIFPWKYYLYRDGVLAYRLCLAEKKKKLLRTFEAHGPCVATKYRDGLSDKHGRIECV